MLLPDRTNNIIMGDFNLHISEGESDANDISATIFIDTCEAMEHITFPTHKTVTPLT